MLPEREKSAVIYKAQMGKCGGCPGAGGGCVTCPLRSGAVRSEGASLGFTSPITETIKKIAASNVFNENHIIIFRSTGTEVVRPISPEKTCSQCGKSPITCHCERNLKAA